MITPLHLVAVTLGSLVLLFFAVIAFAPSTYPDCGRYHFAVYAIDPAKYDSDRAFLAVKSKAMAKLKACLNGEAMP